MITLRARIFAIISIVVLVILAISIALILFSRRSSTPPAGTSSTSPPVETNVQNTGANGANIVTNFEGLQVLKLTT